MFITPSHQRQFFNFFLKMENIERILKVVLLLLEFLETVNYEGNGNISNIFSALLQNAEKILKLLHFL